MWLVFKHCYQVWWWSIEKYWSYIADNINFGNFGLFKGHNSKLFQGIWLVIELGQEIMSTNNVIMFDDDQWKNIHVTEQTRFISAKLANSRAITPKCFMGSVWLSNLAEIFCQQTFSQSLMIIQWKQLKLLSRQMFFFKRAYKNGYGEITL